MGRKSCEKKERRTAPKLPAVGKTRPQRWALPRPWSRDTRTYTLGEFFDIWGQPLSNNRVGPARGPVTTMFNGHLFNGDPRRVPPLLAHAQIQLEVGRPRVAPEQITFSNGL